MKTEHFYRTYIKIVVPLMLQGMVTTLVSMVDNLMVGQLGDTSISAVAVASRVLNIIMFTLLGVTAATGVFIAQYQGAGNKAKQQETFRISILLSTLIFILFALLFLSFPQTIIQFFVQDGRIEAEAVNYLLIMLLGFVPFILSVNYATAMKVVGQVNLPLIASLVGVAVNTFLNYFLIFGNGGLPKMGVSGAAIATVAARFVECAVLYFYSNWKKYDFNTRFRDLGKITGELTRKVVVKAVPLAINEIIWSFGQAFILKLYGVHGSQVIAATSITDTTSAIFFSISRGMSAATPILISQKLGADKFEEAYANAKAMLKTVVYIGLCLGVGMWICSYLIPNFYQVSDLSHNLATQMIQIMGLLYWVYLVNTQCYFVMRAGGEMRSTLLMDGGYMWMATIPILSIATYILQLPILAVFILAQCCELGKMSLGLTFFFKKKWMRNLTY